jgi:hypothetical protein
VDGAPEAGGIDLQIGGGTAHVVSPSWLSFRVRCCRIAPE